MKDMLRVRIHGCGQNFLYLCSFNGTQHKELCSVLVGIPVSIMGSGIPVSIMGSGIPVSIISGNIVYWYQVFQHKELCSVLDGLSLHLVEASPVLSNLQEQTLLKTHSNHSSFSLSAESGAHSSPDDISPYKTTSVDGVKVSWYKHLQDVPHGEFTSPSTSLSFLSCLGLFQTSYPTHILCSQDILTSLLTSSLMLFQFTSFRYEE